MQRIPFQSLKTASTGLTQKLICSLHNIVPLLDLYRNLRFPQSRLDTLGAFFAVHFTVRLQLFFVSKPSCVGNKECISNVLCVMKSLCTHQKVPVQVTMVVIQMKALQIMTIEAQEKTADTMS